MYRIIAIIIIITIIITIIIITIIIIIIIIVVVDVIVVLSGFFQLWKQTHKLYRFSAQLSLTYTAIH